MPAATARPTLETCLRVLFRTAAFPLGMRDRHRILLHRVNLSETCALFDGWVKILALRATLECSADVISPLERIIFSAGCPRRFKQL